MNWWAGFRDGQLIDINMADSDIYRPKWERGQFVRWVGHNVAEVRFELKHETFTRRTEMLRERLSDR